MYMKMTIKRRNCLNQVFELKYAVMTYYHFDTFDTVNKKDKEVMYYYSMKMLLSS